MRLWTVRARRARIVAFLLLLTPWDAAPLRAAGPAAVALGVGEVEVIEDGAGHEIDLEVRFPPRRFHLLPRFQPEIVPLLGTIATTKGTLYAFAGVRADLRLGPRWWFSPSFSGGLYYRAEGQDLGGPVEFRSAIEISYELRWQARVGVCLYHLSNGGIFPPNAGSESLVFTFSAPLGHLSQPSSSF